MNLNKISDFKMKISVASEMETVIKLQPKSNKKLYVPKRIIVMILSFLGMVLIYGMRVNVSVVIVAMVNNSCHTTSNSSDCVSENHEANSDIKGERYSWDPKAQGVIMSAFFYSYFVTMLCGGYFSEKFGAKNIFGGGMLCTSVLNLLTPVSVKWGYAPFVISRVLVGLSEGIVWPAVVGIIGLWAPKVERSRIYVTVFNGAVLGIVFSFSMSGWLSTTTFLGGWPSAFYVFGTLGCIWCFFWFIFIFETPHTHPSIRDDELLLYDDLQLELVNKRKIPWKAFLTSPPLWAAFSSHFGMFFVNSLLMTELPTYLSTVLHFQLAASGFLSTAPYIVQVFGGWIASFAADKLRNSGTLHITAIRKIMDSIGGYGLSLCLIGIALAGYRPYLIIVLFCIGMFIHSFKEAGVSVTHADMSPELCGTTFGICSSISSLSGIIGPVVAGSLTQDGASTSSWAIVFCIAAAVHITTTTIFAIFASADLQSWGKLQYVNQKEEEKGKC